jgi:two-component system, cell cycle response regulator
MRILIAEDEVATRRILVRMLNDWGHETVVTADGNQAWKALQAEDAPHLAILDWMMPGMDGIDVCRRLRALEKDIHPYVLLLTGMSGKKDLVQGFDAGADDYVSKPFDPDELQVRIRAGERIVNLQIESLAARNVLRKLATYDYLTGLHNRAAILAELERGCERVSRLNVPVNLVMVDVDHFKKINDTYGHPFGDKVLAELAKCMVSEVRSYEAVGRYGGEEFLIVLAGCNELGAGMQAERVRRRVEANRFNIQGTKIEVTVSLGVASSCQIERPTQELLIELADAAMYRAKHGGRNRVELASVALPMTSISAASCGA